MAGSSDYTFTSLRIEIALKTRIEKAVEILNQTSLGKVSMSSIIARATDEWLDRFEAEQRNSQKK